MRFFLPTDLSRVELTLQGRREMSSLQAMGPKTHLIFVSGEINWIKPAMDVVQLSRWSLRWRVQAVAPEKEGDPSTWLSPPPSASAAVVSYEVVLFTL